MIGRTLGHYRIVDRLGSGGMGVVWLAEDLKLGRKVALKVLREDLADSPEKAARFEREARAIAALSHPSIVTLHAVEEIDGVPFLAMEHLEGLTLDQLVREGPLPVAELLRIAIPIAEALEAAHARGILHRDLKPSNVMVCTDGRVKVLDFGLAKLLEEPARPFDGKDETTLTREGQVVGTLHYSSPEQLRQETVDARTDIYSFGAVLYEMATGRVPFQGDSAAQVITAVLCDVPRRIDEIEECLPGMLAEVVARCLAKNPVSRPKSAKEVQHQLLELSKAPRKIHRLGGRRAEGISVASRTTHAAVGVLIVGCVLAIAIGLSSRSQSNQSAVEWQERASSGYSEAVAPNGPSIAVLPFHGAERELRYSEGVTDGVIAALGRSYDLRVISRQSSSHFKNSTKSLTEIAAELDVEYVAEGSVEQAGNQLRVKYRLVRVNPLEVVGEEDVDRPIEKVLILYEQIADRLGSMAGAGPRIVSGSRSVPRLVDPLAFEAYLKGAYFVDKMTPAAVDRSIQYFEEALRQDPDFGPAHLGLADAFGLKAYLYEDPSTFVRKQEEAIRAAIRVDPGSGLAHSLLGEQRRYHHWDWIGAEAAFVRAVELEPGNARVRRTYWAFLVSLGRFEAARVHLGVARRLDPLSPAIPFDAGYQALIEGDVEVALREVRRALEMEPGYSWAQALLWLLGHRGELPEGERDAALAGFLESLGYTDLAEDFVGTSSSRSYAERLLSLAQSLEERSHTKRVPLGLGAMIFVAAGDLEGAERWVLRAYAQREPELVWLAQDASLRELRQRPAIQRILRQMKLVPEVEKAAATMY